MTKILILHASLGTGHVSAAQSLGQAFKRLGVDDVQVEDTLDYASGILRSTLNKSYLQMSEKAPQLWRMFFEESDSDDLEDSIRGNMLLGQLGRPFLRKLSKLIQESAPDVIVCTMQIPAMLVSYLKKEGRLNTPLYVTVTDFIAHSTWFNFGVNGYFLPGDITRLQYLARGVDEKLLHVTGIPVNLQIMEPKPMADMRARHNLPLDGPLVTLFGGGITPERMRTMLEIMLQSETPGTLAVVAGRNKKLIAKIEDLSDGQQMKLLKMGRIDFVDDLVAASNLVITKSGGLITSEILARGTPTIIIDPIPGQEEWNADVVAGSGAGLQLRMPEMAAVTALQLLAQPERLTTMRQRTQTVGRPRAALSVAEQIIREMSQ